MRGVPGTVQTKTGVIPGLQLAHDVPLEAESVRGAVVMPTRTGRSAKP